MRRLISHRDERGDKLLETHLHNVASLMVEIGPTGRETAAGTPYETLFSVAGLCHDLPKASPAYQRYLREKGRRDSVGHAPLAALVTYYVLRARNVPPSDSLLGLLAVYYHHRNLPNSVSKLGGIADESGWNGLKEQARSITKNASSFASAIVMEASDGATTWEDFVTALEYGLAEGIQRTLRDPLTQTDQQGNQIFQPNAYGDLLALSGSLTAADKFDAARIEKEPGGSAAIRGHRACPEPIEEKIKSLSSEEGRSEKLDGKRSTIRKSVLAAVRAGIADGPGVYSLTIPTGFGKTYTGLSAAISIGKRTGDDRVVYALPFQAIIDQTEEKLTEIFSTNSLGNLLTVHHAGAETRTALGDEKTGGDEPNGDETDERFREELLLAEAWRAGITLTTFVQLFESMAGPTNRQGLKLPALAESTIIVDEPQAIPMKWRDLVEKLLDILVDRFGCRILLMTATKPHIVSEENVTELYETPEAEYRWANRATYLFDQSCQVDAGYLPYETAAARILDANESGSVLTVCNTKDSAEHLHDRISSPSRGPFINKNYLEKVRDGEDSERIREELVRKFDGSKLPPTILLTTRLRPRDRKVLLAILDELLDRGTRVICVSTQLIEAGVDLSFDSVFRDFGPLDSIVQVAGRCNREFDDTRGSVTVWQLPHPQKGNAKPSGIYDKPPNLLSCTRNALSETVEEEWTERTIIDSVVSWDAANKYQYLVSRQRGKGMGLDHVRNLDCASLRKLHLIESRDSEVDIAILLGEDEEEFVEIIRDPSRTFQERRRATRKLQQVVVTEKRPSWAKSPTVEPLLDEDGILLYRASGSAQRYSSSGLTTD